MLQQLKVEMVRMYGVNIQDGGIDKEKNMVVAEGYKEKEEKQRAGLEPEDDHEERVLGPNHPM